MATDIVPQNEVWGTLSMKPDPGEEGNALWADKIAANEGWLYQNNRETILWQYVSIPANSIDNEGFHTQFYNRGCGTLRFNMDAKITVANGTLEGRIIIPGVGTSGTLIMVNTTQLWGAGITYTILGGTVGWTDVKPVIWAHTGTANQATIYNIIMEYYA